MRIRQALATITLLTMAGCGGSGRDVDHPPPPPPPPPPPSAAAAQPAQEQGVTTAGATDSDHDGVKDPADACPGVPEDLDGFQDADGCPDKDNDGDGVLDTMDKCPNTAGSADSGCPGESGGSSAEPQPVEDDQSVPSKKAIYGLINYLKGPVNKCLEVNDMCQEATVNISIEIEGATGKVVSAEVTSEPFEGTAAATCIETVLYDKVSFEPFEKPLFTVTLPIMVAEGCDYYGKPHF